MLKKYKINKINKTKKGGFTGDLCNIINKESNINNLACILRENNDIKDFIIKIVWDTFIKIKKFDPNYENNIRNNIKEEIDDKNGNKIIKNMGFSEQEINQIIEFIKNENEEGFKTLTFLKDKIHSTTTCIPRLNNESFIFLCTLNDDRLFNEFLNKLKLIYNLPEDFDKTKFIELYNNNKANSKRIFEVLVTKILHTSNNVIAIYQLNYSNEIFSRKRKNLQNLEISNSLENKYKCFDDIQQPQIDKKFEIYSIDNYYDISNTFTKIIFDYYNRTSISSISGSSYFLYFLLFKILKYEKTKDNLAKLLCITVLDYVPLWHSLEEILLTLSSEFKGIFPKYYINQDPLEYFKQVVCKEIIGGKYKSKNKRFTKKYNKIDQ